jgi:hypothetical protein
MLLINVLTIMSTTAPVAAMPSTPVFDPGGFPSGEFTTS